MKSKKMLFTSTLLATALVAGSFLYANSNPAGGKHGKRHAMLGKLLKLNITEGQKSEIIAILKKHQPAVSPLVDQLLVEREKLSNLIHASHVDEGAIRVQSQKVGQVEADMAVKRALIYQELSPILTEEQRARVDELRIGFFDKAGEIHDKVVAFLEASN